MATGDTAKAGQTTQPTGVKRVSPPPSESQTDESDDTDRRASRFSLRRQAAALGQSRWKRVIGYERPASGGATSIAALTPTSLPCVVCRATRSRPTGLDATAAAWVSRLAAGRCALAARVRPRIDTDWGLLGVTSWPARGPAPFGRLSAGRRSRGRFRGAAPSHRSPGVSRAARAGWGVSSDPAWLSPVVRARRSCASAARRRASACSQARFELAR